MIEADSNPRRHEAFAVRSAEVPAAVAAAGRRALALACVLLALAAAPSRAASESAAPAPAAGPPITNNRVLDGVVAVVDGDPITLRELKRYGVSGAPFLPPDVRSDYRALLDSMIEHRLLKAEFEKHGIVATDAIVDRYIAGVLEESKQSRASLESDIAKAGLSWKDYYERMREEVQRIQLINLLIRSRVNVPEEEVRRVWESNPEYLESEKLVVGLIFLPSGPGAGAAAEQAEQVRKDAKRDFEAAARKYSKGPGAAEGGNLGEFKRGTMAAHLEKGLKGLRKGDVSEPVEGPGGLFIVKLIDIKASGRRPFEEVKEELTEKLYEQRLNERYQKWATEDLRRDHRVDNLIDSLALIAAGS